MAVFQWSNGVLSSFATKPTVATVIKAPVDATRCHIALCKHEVAGKCACGNSVCISHEFTLHIKEADYSITKKMMCAACRWKK